MAPLRSRFPQKERCWPICRAAAGFLLELGGDLRAVNWFSSPACFLPMARKAFAEKGRLPAARKKTPRRSVAKSHRNCSMRERAGFCSSREDPLDRASQPLAGKRVVVTRAPEQASELIRELERLGAEVLILPTVSFAPPSDWQPVDSALRAIDEFDWILLTSQNAVRFLAQRLRELKLDPKVVATEKPSIAAVGAATAQIAAEAGFRVDYTAQERSGEGLARELQASLRNGSVLLPRSDRADDRLPTSLREAGAQVTEVVAYRAAAPKELDAQIVDRVQRAEV